MENRLIEQRVSLKLYFKNGIPCAQALKKLRKTYGNQAISKSQAYRWYKAFEHGRKEVGDLPRSGRPSTCSTDENVKRIKELLLANQQYSLRELAFELNISYGSVQNIINDVLRMKRVGTRLVPKDLTILQKENRKNFAESIINRANTDSTFMKRIITGGETWFCKTKQQNLKSHKSPYKFKVLLTVFFDHQGIVHTEFLPDEETIDESYYLGNMERLRENIRYKRPNLWKDNSWILHYHKYDKDSGIMNEFLTKNPTTVIEQQSDSPDMAPTNFFLFPKLFSLRRTLFKSKEETKKKLIKEIESIPEYDFKKCFDDWLVRCKKCVALNGAYVEVDEINVGD